MHFARDTDRGARAFREFFQENFSIDPFREQWIDTSVEKRDTRLFSARPNVSSRFHPPKDRVGSSLRMTFSIPSSLYFSPHGDHPGKPVGRGRFLKLDNFTQLH
ncbi:MAG: hypothetical protein NDJ89_06770 [Oligoflexia bacterium]|nr:hypothetical protein [Oligoflexia bacterium]